MADPQGFTFEEPEGFTFEEPEVSAEQSTAPEQSQGGWVNDMEAASQGLGGAGLKPVVAALKFLREHPALTKVGGTMGALAAAPAVIPAGMGIGGALGIMGGMGMLGSTAADAASQAAQYGTPEAPQDTSAALGRSGRSALEGLGTGVLGGGGLAGAPAVLRAAASPAGVGAITTGMGLYGGQSPMAAGAEGIAAASGMGIARMLGNASGSPEVAKLLESLGLRRGSKVARAVSTAAEPMAKRLERLATLAKLRGNIPRPPLRDVAPAPQSPPPRLPEPMEYRGRTQGPRPLSTQPAGKPLPRVETRLVDVPRSHPSPEHFERLPKLKVPPPDQAPPQAPPAAPPPAQSGMVSLYRGGPPSSEAGTKGVWYTTDRKLAEKYMPMSGGRVSSVDVTPQQLHSFDQGNYPGGEPIYMVSPEVAARARTVQGSSTALPPAAVRIPQNETPVIRSTPGGAQRVVGSFADLKGKDLSPENLKRLTYIETPGTGVSTEASGSAKVLEDEYLAELARINKANEAMRAYKKAQRGKVPPPAAAASQPRQRSAEWLAARNKKLGITVPSQQPNPDVRGELEQWMLEKRTQEALRGAEKNAAAGMSEKEALALEPGLSFGQRGPTPPYQVYSKETEDVAQLIKTLKAKNLSNDQILAYVRNLRNAN